MKRNRLVAFLVCNLILAILEVIGLGTSLKTLGLGAFVFYTELSNLLLLVAALINIVFSIRELRKKKLRLPNFVWRIMHAAVSTTTVTFLVVVFVLSWMYSDLIWILTHGSMLYTHTLCPILGIVIHCVFAPKIFSKRAALQASGLTVLYAIVAVIMNIARIWVGPYPFLMVYDQPIWASLAWMVGMLGGAWGISRLLLVKKIKN